MATPPEELRTTLLVGRGRPARATLRCRDDDGLSIAAQRRAGIEPRGTPGVALEGRQLDAIRKRTLRARACGCREIVDALAESIAEESVHAERFGREHPKAAALIGAMVTQWKSGVQDVRAGL